MTLRPAMRILGALAFLLLLAVLSTVHCACRSATPAPARPASRGVTAAPHSCGAPAPIPALSVPDPSVLEPHYRLRLQLGPTVAGILPAYVSPVECRIPLAELQQRLKLAEAAATLAAANAARQAEADAADRQRRADLDALERLRWLFGVPLLAIGLVGLILGAYLTIKGADLGADLALLAALTAATGLVLYLYPRQAGWAAAALVGAVVVYAIVRAIQRARTRRHAAAVVASVDSLRASVGEADWKSRIAPIISRAQAPATAAFVARLQTYARASCPPAPVRAGLVPAPATPAP
jgi:hypothetical protein